MGTVAAEKDIVEIGGIDVGRLAGHGINVGITIDGGGTRLVGEGDGPRPLGSAATGAAHGKPTAIDRVIDPDAGIRVGIVTDIRDTPVGVWRPTGLPGRGSINGAKSSAAARPRGFRNAVIVGVQHQRGSADADDIGGHGGPLYFLAAVTSGGDEDNVRGLEVRVEEVLVNELGGPPAHRDDGSAGIHGGGDRLDHVAEARTGRDREHDGGIGGDGVGPFHVQGRFKSPRGVGSAGPDDLNAGARNAKLGAESIQVGLDGGIAIGIHDGDDLASTVGGELVKPVGMADLSRGVVTNPKRVHHDQ